MVNDCDMFYCDMFLWQVFVTCFCDRFLWQVSVRVSRISISMNDAWIFKGKDMATKSRQNNLNREKRDEEETYKWQERPRAGLLQLAGHTPARRAAGCSWRTWARWWHFRLAWSRSGPSISTGIRQEVRTLRWCTRNRRQTLGSWCLGFWKYNFSSKLIAKQPLKQYQHNYSVIWLASDFLLSKELHS